MTRCVFPFNYLRFRVSHHCLELLFDELERMRSLSDQVFRRCGCVLRATCGIPCACELAHSFDSKQPITLDRIHEFWKTFKINETGRLAQDSGSHDPTEDMRYFDELADKVRQADPAVMRNISLLMNNHLHPEQASYGEPEIKGNPRGRPRGGSSTRRDPSKWEYMGRGRSRGRARGSGRSSSRGSCSSTHNADGEDTDTEPIDRYQNKHRIPGIILPYTRGVVDVRPDGNCGFRTLAHYMTGDEDEYKTVRGMIWNEIAANRELYKPLYGDVDAALERIGWFGGQCTQENWMHNEDLFAFASAWQAAIIVFGFGDGHNSDWHSSTYLPIKAPPLSGGPEREIVIGHLGTGYEHFICLSMHPNLDFPVPYINNWWHQVHTESVADWDDLYSARIDVYRNLLHASQQ